MCAQKWRGFAGDFAPGEVRYDEFEAAGGTAADKGATGTAASASKVPHASLMAKGSDLLAGVDKEQRMAALKKKIVEEQKKQVRREERRKQKLQEEAEEWCKKHEELKAKEKEERKEHIARLAAANARTKTRSRVQDSSAIEASATLGESINEGDDSSFFLTGIGDSDMPVIPPEYKDRIRIPPMPKFARFKSNRDTKPRRAAVPLFRKKPQDGDKLPKLVDAQGKLMSAVLPNPDEPTMPVKEGLRKAQAKMMKQLSGSVSFYRAHMRKQFKRVLEVTELQFGDVAARRKQAAWNLAKPLSITEIKQMQQNNLGAKIQQQ